MLALPGMSDFEGEVVGGSTVTVRKVHGKYMTLSMFNLLRDDRYNIKIAFYYVILCFISNELNHCYGLTLLHSKLNTENVRNRQKHPAFMCISTVDLL